MQFKIYLYQESLKKVQNVFFFFCYLSQLKVLRLGDSIQDDHDIYFSTCKQDSQITRGSSQSQQDKSLSLKKTSKLKKIKILTTPKLGAKKTVIVIAFIIVSSLDVKVVRVGRQKAVCVNKWHKNANFGLSRFQKFNFDGLLIKLLICSSKAEKYSALCVLYRLRHLS